MKASKSPTHRAAKKPPVQAVQHVQTVQVVESFEGSGNPDPDPDVLAQEIVEDVEAALEQFREIATDLGGEVVELEKS